MRRIALLLAIVAGMCVQEISAQTNNLHIFVKQRDYDNVAHYINRHEDVNAFDDFGYTPLMYAADLGLNDIVKVLMDNGAEPNYLTLWDNEPPALHAAVLSNFPSTVGLLLQYERTKVDLRDSAGYAPLYHAVRNGYIDCADTLIAHGADPNIAYNGRVTALMVAASFNDTAMASLLIRHGANVNLVADGKTAFSVAAACGAVDAARLLVSNGADINNGYPVHYAAMYADTAMIAYLNSIGLDMNAGGADGYSPRDLAIINAKRRNAAVIKDLGGHSNSFMLLRCVSISEFQEFCKREFRMGMQLGLHELRSNMAVYVGGSFRPAYKPALVQESEHLYYQMREKRGFFHATVEKRFSFNHGSFPDCGASLAYEFACASGKYDGSLSLTPMKERFHVPCLGFYGRFRNIGMSAGYKYYGYKHELDAPKGVANISIQGFIVFRDKNYPKF